MEIDATAQALAGEDLPVDAPINEQSEDDALAAAFDRLTAEDEPDGEAEIEAETAEEPAPEPPSDLPAGLKAHWAKIPDEAREAVTASHRELSRKLSEAGRMTQGLSPIKDVLVEASRQMPHLMNMKPEQVAAEVMSLAKVSQDFTQRPVETMLGLIKQHGLERAMQQALSGQAVTQDARQSSALQNEIAQLKRQLSQVTNPDYLREQVSAVTMMENATAEVTRFAQGADHWEEVEPHLPKIIPIFRDKMHGASNADILKASYEMALDIYLPEAKAKAKAAVQAAQPDPVKAEAVKRAKSVNVQGQISGKARELSEDEMLAAVYERAQRK
jgi:hypothetical protein